MTMTTSPREMGPARARKRITGALVLADGTVFEGFGLGATGHAVGEVCFNTAMTGYQEILTDPSYAAQIVCFTFPHIGNVGTNAEDIETVTPAARGMIVKAVDHRSVELPQRATSRHLAQAPQHRGPGRHRHAPPDAPHPRERHAERRHRPRRDRHVRYRSAEKRSRKLARPRRHGPRQRRDRAPNLDARRNALGLGQRLRRATKTALQRRRHRLRREAQHPALAGQHRRDG